MCLFKRKGQIEIKLDSYNFKYEDIVKGKILVNINKNLTGKELYVKLTAYKKVNSYDSEGHTRKEKKILFIFKQPLESLKDYSVTNKPLEYSFEIKLPSKASVDPMNTTKVGQVIDKISRFTGNSSRVYWELESKLNIKKSLFNIKKKIDLNVS